MRNEVSLQAVSGFSVTAILSFLGGLGGQEGFEKYLAHVSKSVSSSRVHVFEEKRSRKLTDRWGRMCVVLCTSSLDEPGFQKTPAGRLVLLGPAFCRHVLLHPPQGIHPPLSPVFSFPPVLLSDSSLLVPPPRLLNTPFYRSWVPRGSCTTSLKSASKKRSSPCLQTCSRRTRRERARWMKSA